MRVVTRAAQRGGPSRVWTVEAGPRVRGRPAQPLQCAIRRAVGGALGILIPFALLQFHRTGPHSWLYLGLNAAGSAVLTWLAVAEAQWGFVILQGVWALTAVIGMLRRAVGSGHAVTQG